MCFQQNPFCGRCENSHSRATGGERGISGGFSLIFRIDARRIKYSEETGQDFPCKRHSSAEFCHREDSIGFSIEDV